ncbi:uncharacterized protein LOC109835446 [Asparagus officinalis]|uniref:uncharacterized protein LOC109835446 n=1 Tax=Asparagus officinalis TaxID=4686 RepID=UPI00098E5C9F|nr:uncharacterized protein LOC109835446 [Asparagus officinalis]
MVLGRCAKEPLDYWSITTKCGTLKEIEVIEAIMSGLKLILEQNKLTGPNYKDWLRNVKISLIYDKVAYVLTTPEPVLGPEPTVADNEICIKWDRDYSLAQCLTIASMDLVHQRQHENMDVRSIFRNTEELYGEQP